MRITTILLLLSLSLFAINLDKIIEEMEEDGVETRHFYDKTEGEVIVAREAVPINGKAKEDDALSNAIARCEEKIIGVQDGKTYSSDETFQSNDNSKILSKNSTESVRGKKFQMELYSHKKKGNVLHVICYTSDRLDRETTSKTNAAGKSHGSSAEYYEVTVKGIASIELGRAKAREMALNKARQDAVKQILGTTLAGSTTVNQMSIVKIDSNGKEHSSTSEFSSSKLYTSSSGFSEIIKVLEEGERDGFYTVTARARVYKDRLEEDYSPALKQLGNPGFYVEADGTHAKVAQAYFNTRLHDLGFKMFQSPYDAEYTLSVKVKFIPSNGTKIPSITLTMKQKSTGESLMDIHNDLSSLAVELTSDIDADSAVAHAATLMELLFHRTLNNVIGKMNANGRRFTIRLEGNTQCYSNQIDAVKEIIEALVSINNLNTNSNIKAQVTDFTFDYTGDSRDLARSLEKAFESNILKKKNRPKLKETESNRLIFTF